MCKGCIGKLRCLYWIVNTSVAKIQQCAFWFYYNVVIGFNPTSYSCNIPSIVYFLSSRAHAAMIGSGRSYTSDMQKFFHFDHKRDWINPPLLVSETSKTFLQVIPSPRNIFCLRPWRVCSYMVAKYTIGLKFCPYSLAVGNVGTLWTWTVN